MDIRYVNPFLESFKRVMPLLGFSSVEKGSLSLKNGMVTCNGAIMIVGIIGEVKGTIVYSLPLEDAKKVASIMMMGMPVDTFDELAQSAISELANLLAANAATSFSEDGITVDISTPSLLYGDQVQVKVNSKQIIGIQMIVDGITIEVNVGFEHS